MVVGNVRETKCVRLNDDDDDDYDDYKQWCMDREGDLP